MAVMLLVFSMVITTPPTFPTEPSIFAPCKHRVPIDSLSHPYIPKSYIDLPLCRFNMETYLLDSGLAEHTDLFYFAKCKS